MYLLAIGTGVLRLLAFYVISCFLLLLPFESCLFQTFGYLLVFSAGLHDIGRKFWPHRREHSWAFLTLIYRARVVSVYSELERDVEVAVSTFLSLLDSISFSCFFSFSFLSFTFITLWDERVVFVCVGCFLMISDEFVYARA